MESKENKEKTVLYGEECGQRFFFED